jgi:hypothetical protein
MSIEHELSLPGGGGLETGSTLIERAEEARRMAAAAGRAGLVSSNPAERSRGGYTQDPESALWIPDSYIQQNVDEISEPNMVETTKPKNSALDQVKDAIIKDEFINSLDLSNKVYSHIDLVPADFDQFATAGADIALFAERFLAMVRDRKKPIPVITTPMPLAPDGTGVSHIELMTTMDLDKTISNRGFRRFENDSLGRGAPGLYVDRKVYDRSNEIYRQEVSRIKRGMEDGTIHAVEKDGRLWILSLVSGTKGLLPLNGSHQDSKSKRISLSNYLSLQARLIQERKDLLGERRIPTYFDFDGVLTTKDEKGNVTRHSFDLFSLQDRDGIQIHSNFTVYSFERGGSLTRIPVYA